MKPTEVHIKTERDINIQLEIKQEPDRSRRDTSIPNSNPQACGSWAKEKSNLIDKIVSLKSENQKIIFDLKKSQNDLASLIATNTNLEKRIKQTDENHLKELGQLKSENFELNAALEMMKTDSESKIAQLMREKDLLQARFKQLQKGIELQQIIEVTDNEENYDDQMYEVECLLKDKMIRKNRVYLVRWKGFDSPHDSWVEESNLNCPVILEQYKCTKK